MPEWLIILLGGIIASSPGIYAIFANRRKIKAEAAQIVSDAAAGMVTRMQNRLDRVEKRLEKLETKNAMLEAKVQELKAELNNLRDVLRELWIVACEQAEELQRPLSQELAQRVIRAIEDGTSQE